jgi:hypothetical protein
MLADRDNHSHAGVGRLTTHKLALLIKWFAAGLLFTLEVDVGSFVLTLFSSGLIFVGAIRLLITLAAAPTHVTLTRHKVGESHNPDTNLSIMTKYLMSFIFCSSRSMIPFHFCNLL